jgi:hypothetical protein
MPRTRVNKKISVTSKKCKKGPEKVEMSGGRNIRKIHKKPDFFDASLFRKKVRGVHM